MAKRIHTHTCRECDYGIDCTGRENANGCTVWNGSNDGCANCGHEYHPGRPSDLCDNEFRCAWHYPGTPAETSDPVEHDWEMEVGELRAAERAYYRNDY